MKIKDVMLKPVFISPDATKKDLFRVVKKNPQTDLFIIADKKRKFLGDLHINDLFLMFLPDDRYEDIGVELAFDIERKFFAKNAKELMRKHDFNCKPEDDLLNTALILGGLEVNEMPVINDNEQVVGVVTERLLIRYLKKK